MGRKSSIETEGMALLMERFPEVAFLLPAIRREEKKAEAVDLGNYERAEILYFYGLGVGEAYFLCKEWLLKGPNRQLVFLEEDLEAIASFITREEALEILSNPQVHLSRVDIEGLTERFPVRRVEVLSLPSRNGKKFRDIRLKLLRKTALSHVLHLDRLHGHQPFESFLKNIHHLANSFYANGLKGAFQGVPAVICGAGPSLQRSIDLLRTFEKKALIIAGGSTIAALSSQGIMPHFGMAVDPNLEEYRRMKNSFAFEVPFLYSTRVFPGVFQTCNGPFGYMRSGMGGILELWMEEELGLQGPLLGELLSEESVSVTALCIAWGLFLGCDPILLNGVDLAYTGNKRYAAGVAEEEELLFRSIDAEKSAPDRIVKRKDRNGQMVHTAIRWVIEAASLGHFAKEHPSVRFFNTTEGGLPIPHIEFLSLSEGAEKYLDKEFDLRREIHSRIDQSPMPTETKSVIRSKVQDLLASLNRVVGHLKILAGKEKGSSALAEMDLKEEMAFCYLFYDAETVISKLPSNKDKWELFLELALRYQDVACKYEREMTCLRQ